MHLLPDSQKLSNVLFHIRLWWKFRRVARQSPACAHIIIGNTEFELESRLHRTGARELIVWHFHFTPETRDFAAFSLELLAKAYKFQFISYSLPPHVKLPYWLAVLGYKLDARGAIKNLDCGPDQIIR